MLKQLFWDCFQSYFVVEVFRNFSAELFNFKILSLIPKKSADVSKINQIQLTL